MEHILRILKKIIPVSLFRALQPAYHFALAFLGACVYGFPSKKLVVIGVTGSKGKTTTAELINSVFETAGFTTALAGTLRFKIGKESEDNLFKMTMPGRFFLQRFLYRAVKKGVTHVVVEMSSEGVLQYRHRFLYLDALVFTNIEPEHIESHGSYEKYVLAKIEIGKRVLNSGKGRRILVLNKDDKEAGRFERIGIPEVRPFSLKDAEPYELREDGVSFNFKNHKLSSPLLGTFNVLNMLAAATLADALGINVSAIEKAFAGMSGVRGRMQKVDVGQKFPVIVDYAHTPRSLESVYETYSARRKICVLSGTGGGRDKWKRPLMGEIADKHCSVIILTDEDPYDEDPHVIIADIKKGITRADIIIEMDRRKAIRKALEQATERDVVLITGKGTDPYIMGPHGSKIPWSDAGVAEEELLKIKK